MTDSPHGLLTGRTIVVTGASRGIGALISLVLASAGARVALLARSLARLDDVVRRCGNDSFPVECDLTVQQSIDTAVATITQQLDGPPDVLVNNAGLFTIRSLEDTMLPEFDAILATNLRAPFAFIKAFLPGMRMRGSGHIVTIGSIADRHIFEGNAAYSATKYGERAIHEVLRAETRGTGVRATLVSPASVSTDIWEHIRYHGSDARPDRSQMLDPSAVGAAVLYAVTQPDTVNVDELRLSRS